MDESQELIYEESEVLWAKIRGYPWWPAYVSDVHEAESPSDYQYTVIFFGDNTKYLDILQKVSSRLGPSKLRKFPEHYAECFVKAKTNKKLRQSIQKAEQRLSENHQDISYYQNIRNDLNFKRKKNGAISQSRLSSSEKGDPEEAPDLVKHKTQQPIRNRRRRQQKKDEQIFEQQSVQNLQNSKSGRSNEKLVRPLPQVRRRRNEKLPPTANIKKSPIKSQQLQQRMQQSPQPKRNNRSKQMIESPKIERERYNMRSNQKSKQKIVEQQNNQEKQMSAEEMEEKQEPVKITPVKPKKGRKGRPPKHEKLKQKQQEQAQQSDDQDAQPIPQQPLKPRKKPLSLPPAPNPPSSSPTPFPQQQKLRQCLSNRKQLIKQLFNTQITISNIKQILDLGTSVILQNGPITKNIHLLLLLLKSTLLYKYFPDNNKYRKKYEKLSKEKKKAIVGIEDEDEEEVVDDVGSFQELGQGKEDKSQDKDRQNQGEAEEDQLQKTRKQVKVSANKENKQQNKQMKTQRPQSAQKQGKDQQKLTQIRKKANQKLQKMIRKTGLQQKAKDYAQRIQNTFQNTAEAQKELYRNVAYRRMRNLKTKLLEFCDREALTQEVAKYLDDIIEVYENEAHTTVKV